MKICSLHPDFAAKYRYWVEEENKGIKFTPEALNRQYSVFREVIFGIIR